jgi:hypothetical protein
MPTAASSRVMHVTNAISLRAGLGLTVLALAAGGCGGTHPAPAASTPHASPAHATMPAGRGSTFAWLRPGRPPGGWPVARIATGATLPFPTGWRPEAGDAGTATAVLQGADHAILGFLNLTPRQGGERVRTWAAFRLAHNAQEGDRDGKALAVGTGLRFRSGRGSCILDAYATTTGARYTELACLVTGRKASSVIVGAAPPQLWSRMSPLIERAISAFTT